MTSLWHREVTVNVVAGICVLANDRSGGIDTQSSCGERISGKINGNRSGSIRDL